MCNKSSLLFTIPYHTFDKWYVEFYLNQKEYSSKYDMLLLRELMKPVKRVIKKQDYDGQLPIVSKIVFKTGQVIFRKENKTGMDLLDVHFGDLLVSSINFHQGAVALNNIGNFVCSTHYQTFKINVSKINPEFLVLILRLPKFLEMVAGVKANGIKNESGYDFIGGFRIPVPPLPEQQKLLNEYKETIERANLLSASAENIDSEIDAYLYSYFNMDSSEDTVLSTSLLRTFKLSKSHRWDVDYALNDKALDYLDGCNCPVVPARDFILATQYGLSEKAGKDCSGIPILRMGNIKDSQVDITDLKYLPKTDILKGRYLKKGDLLFNRTNSKELVGKTAVFDLDGEYVFASYLIRVKIDSVVADVNFINDMFASRIIRRQIDLVSRQVLGQVNMNVGELSDLRFPLPSLAEQKKIVAEIDKIRKRKKSRISDANRFLAQGRAAFENALFV